MGGYNVLSTFVGLLNVSFCASGARPAKRFVKNLTPPDFQAKILYPLFLPNFNSFGDKNTKMSENGEIYPVGKNFTLPPAVTAVTNLISESSYGVFGLHLIRIL